MQTDMSAWIILLLVSLAVVILIPYAAWNGRPRGFTRLNWFGVTVGAGLVGFILIPFGFNVSASKESASLAFPLFCGAGILIAVGIGSLVAVFFCRPSG